MSIERAQNFKFPQVFSRFRAKDSNSHAIVDYVVQDIPENRFEEVIQFMVDQVLPDEPICRFAKIVEDPKAFESCREEWKRILPQNVSLFCLKETTNEIVGVNILKMVSESDDDESFLQVF
jgi:hypothetical protein